MRMLVVSEYYQNDKNFAVNNQLTDFVRENGAGLVCQRISQGVRGYCIYPSKRLTNSALVYEPKCGGVDLRGLSQCLQLYTGAQINFGDLAPYLLKIRLNLYFSLILAGKQFFLF
jgi:hypothetical protein